MYQVCVCRRVLKVYRLLPDGLHGGYSFAIALSEVIQFFFLPLPAGRMIVPSIIRRRPAAMRAISVFRDANRARRGSKAPEDT